MKISSKQMNIIKWVCVALMVVIFALQFVPNWSVDGNGISISSYLWFPEDHASSVESVIEGSVSVDDIVVVAICQLVASLVGAILHLKKKPSPFSALVPIVAGAAGVWACLTKPAYQAGSLWIAILAVSIVLLILSIVMFVLGMIDMLTDDE